MALLQCALYLLQENLERSVHGLPTAGAGPLFDHFGAAAWIQAAIAVLMAALLAVALRALSSRSSTAVRIERLARSLTQRRQPSTAIAPTPGLVVVPARLLLRSAIWQRPPPVLLTA